MTSEPIDLQAAALLSPHSLDVKKEYQKHLESILVTGGGIASRVARMAQDINKEYSAGSNMLALCVLDGAMTFYVDLTRQLRFPYEIATIQAKSYENDESSGVINFSNFLFPRATGRHVLVFEDIIDTGRTLTALNGHLLEQNPLSIEYVTLLDKPSGRDPNVEIEPKYRGFTCPDAFVIGYGLDYNDHFRDLQHIGIPTQEAIARFAKKE